MTGFKKKIESMSDADIRLEVSNGIASGAIGKRQLNDIICYLENERPEIFNSEVNGFKRIEDQRLWDRSYLNHIHNSIICGYFSKEILLHMEKVSSKLFFKYRIGICGVVIGIMGIIWLLISFFK